MCHEQVKNPLHQQNHWWSVFFYLFSNGFFYPSMNGRSWTCLFGPSMNKIVCQEPLFSRSWTALWHCSATCVHSPLMNTPIFAGRLSQNLSLKQEFEPPGWIMSLQAGIWASRLGFEPPSWDLSVQAGIWASRLGYGPRDWDLSLRALIWASRLRFEPQDWDLSLKIGIWASRLGF